MGERDLRRRNGRGDRVADGALVRAVDVGVEQSHRDRRDLALSEGVDRALHRGCVERDEHGPVVPAPLAHDQTVFPQGKGPGPGHVQVVNRAAVLSADFEHVAKTFGRHESDARQFEMNLAEQGIRRNCRRVRDERDAGSVDLLEQRAHRIEQSVLGRSRRRRDLPAHEPPVIGERDEVGKGSADVDADAPTHDAIPRNASRTSGSSRNAAAGPSSTTRPV